MRIRAPEFPSNGSWLNTKEELSLSRLRGHVILLDFWTYCCINCMHVIPELKGLEEKYRNDPFIVIGVHSAKFENERNFKNIKSAISRYEIEHPVFVDNDYRVWNSYAIKAWPSFVIIDSDGNIVSNTSGEGMREYLDEKIFETLAKDEKKGNLSKTKIEIQFPEIEEALLAFPGKITSDNGSETIYVSDSNHNRIIELRLKADDVAEVSRVFGSGKKGNADGNISEAEFNRPQGLALFENHLYVADTENHLIRRINLKTGLIETIAGNGIQGYKRIYRGNSLRVGLNSPWDLVVLNNYIYIAMAGNHQIWRFDPKEKTIENFAGSGYENIIDGEVKTSAFAQPSGISTDGKVLYVADSEVSAVRKIDPSDGKVHTLVGKGLFDFGNVDGDLKHALLQHPIGIEYHEGALYIADTYNHSIKKINLGTGRIDSLIRSSSEGLCKVGSTDCTVLSLNEPNDVLWYRGKIYITDTNNHLIRFFDPDILKLNELQIQPL